MMGTKGCWYDRLNKKLKRNSNDPWRIIPLMYDTIFEAAFRRFSRNCYTPNPLGLYVFEVAVRDKNASRDKADWTLLKSAQLHVNYKKSWPIGCRLFRDNKSQEFFIRQ